MRVERLISEPREWACWGERLRLSEVARVPNIFECLESSLVLCQILVARLPGFNDLRRAIPTIIDFVYSYGDERKGAKQSWLHDCGE